MDISWTTVLCSFIGSIVASGVFSGVVACVLGAYIQHKNDKKLADYKSEIQQMLDEHQIQFKHWHEEKAKAIKELYADASELYADLNYLQSVETDPVWRVDKNNQEQARNDFRNQAVLCMKKTVEDWSKLRLFLESNEDNLFAELNIKTGLWFNVLLNPDPEQRLKFLENNREEMQKDIDGVMDKLRTSFREALYVATKEASQNTVNPSSNSSNQNEVK